MPWVGSSQPTACLDLGARHIEPLKADGFPIAVVLRDDAEVPPPLAVGFGLGALVEPAPRSGAARLFLNWLALPGGASGLEPDAVERQRARGSEQHLGAEYTVPKPGGYFDSVSWERTFEARSPAQREKLKILTRRAGLSGLSSG